MDKRILIVDDDPTVVTSLSLLLKQAGFRSDGADKPERAFELMDRKYYDLVLQDMNFSRKTTGEEGLEMLRKLKTRYPHLPVILITGWGSISLAVEGIRAGASDFITKPWSNEQIVQSVKTALGLAEAYSTVANDGPVTRRELDQKYDFVNVIGENPEFLRILDIIGRVSPTDASVLIVGESGTGKEILAEALHRNSRRGVGPFVKVNLGGISASLFESEMFGHVKGAFTDAKQDRKGRFELANGGTIFLDEIGDLELECQVKLLRVLQDRTYEVLGSSFTRTVDVRVISATNRNLSELIERGEFREDLLYRLNLIALHIPPLRERPEDIALLVNHFLTAIGKVYRRPGITVSEAGLQWLQKSQWPGNIRELKQLVERTVLLSSSQVIDVGEIHRAFNMQLGEAQRDLLPGVGTMTLDEMECAMVAKAMAHHNNNVAKVAEALGISRAALYRRLEKFGIKS
ncbi:MAG: sigma-54-dependent Fis family transcriptional regulator [Desulfobacterales bacterium]|nr:MAG: sigma-54-dependent Fis family transcriptional regulator [Desulfobacterales bacterium]